VLGQLLMHRYEDIHIDDAKLVADLGSHVSMVDHAFTVLPFVRVCAFKARLEKTNSAAKARLVFP
jgi:hypothetical protein